MTITLALDPLTAMELPPVEFVEAAARNSCRTVPLVVQGSRPFASTLDHRLIGDTAARRALFKSFANTMSPSIRSRCSSLTGIAIQNRFDLRARRRLFWAPEPSTRLPSIGPRIVSLTATAGPATSRASTARCLHGGSSHAHA